MSCPPTDPGRSNAAPDRPARSVARSRRPCRQASAASVGLSVEHDRLRVQGRDDGGGGADATTGTGLRGLRDRVDALDGDLEIDSPPGGGTTVTVTVQVPVR